MRSDNSKCSPPTEEILDAAVDLGQRDTNGQSSLTNCLHALLEAIRLGSLTIIVELGPESQRVLAEAETHLKRLADHFDPPPSDIVDTPYIAHRLVHPNRIAQLVRSGEIPKVALCRAAARVGNGSSTVAGSRIGWPSGRQ